MSLKDLLSPSIHPGDDFYHYVNKKWIDSHPIPLEKSSVGTFTELSDENLGRLKELLDSTSPAPYNIKLAKIFYRAAMDESAIEEAGLKPLQPQLNNIAELKSPEDIMAFIIDRHSEGRSLLWNSEVEIDDENSTRYVLRFHQSGLGMPDREYYLDNDEKFQNIRQQYRVFLTELFSLLGKDGTEAAAQANNVLAIEMELAKVSATATERHDPEATYNLYSHSQLVKELPDFDWTRYFSAIGKPDIQELVISWPPFMKGAISQLHNQKVDDWQSYLTFHYLLPLMDKLPQAYDQLKFGFYGKVLSGAEQQEPRFRRIIRLIERVLPEPLGQLYVEAYFNEQAKQEIYDLVTHLQRALAGRIQRLDWMGDETKGKALEKLDTFMPLLGYPDTWKDYSEVKADKSHVENFLETIQVDWQYRISRIDGPVDRKEWGMSPATVNAYYWPNTNQLTFPAGILQPPFFDAAGDFAANYGGIGMVIGHEMLHGFDDDGSKYDKDGNMRSWWTKEDREAFEARVKKLEEQYSAYEVNGRHINGKLTLGENIADLGGILLALDGLHNKLEESGQRQPVEGLTPEQRFFISNAFTWGQNMRPELRMQYLITDPHSPNLYRVNGVVVNCDAFYEAFDVKPEHALYVPPKDRVRIW